MEDIAARVAPELDRLRLSIAKGIMPHMVEIIGPTGIGEAGGYLLAMLRNTLPHRSVDRSAVMAIFQYGQLSRFEAGMAELTPAGLIELTDDRIAVSDTGRAMLDRLHAVSADFIDALWRGHEELTTRLSDLTYRCLAAATDGGATFSVVAPPYIPPGASDAARLAESLTSLRFHRYDAHTAAWRSAGLTIEQVMALGDDDPMRAAIERETNRRAATLYAALSKDEAETLVAGLAALPSA